MYLLILNFYPDPLATNLWKMQKYVIYLQERESTKEEKIVS